MAEQALNLYYIHSEDEDGGSLDLLVHETSLENAVNHWRKYYELEASEDPEKAGEVPASKTSGPVSWDFLAAYQR